MLEHTDVAESDGTAFPSGPFDRSPVKTPLLDFIEDFVVEFLQELDRIVPLAGRFAGVIGGSLGGNLGLRLGRRDHSRSPWLRAGIVSWAAASVWAPMVQDLIKGLAPRRCRTKWSQEEGVRQRREYFEDVFERVVVPLLVHHTQPSMWYRASWEPHKTARIAQSRRERYEIYGPSFRRWHWRVAGEQLVYSHIDREDRSSPTSPARHAQNTVRQLLVAGALDDFPGSNIYTATRELASRMKGVPGRSLFVLDTGHSIHCERPRFLAEEIARFLLDEA
jgi:pimeloyl-ACP methyl ester carboxylesterase